jgi:diacylglycerol kinase family enzyme
MFKLAFLINPVSGGGVGRDVYARLEEILDSFGVKRESWTAELTDASRLAEQADDLIRSARTLIAVGGDGTLGIVLDRVRRMRPNTAIGLIPLGTGNDLGRALGVYRVYNAKGLVACLKRLLKAPSLPFDLWDAGDGKTTVVSYLSAGLDAGVLRAFDRARKRGKLFGGALGNKLYYLRAFLQRLRYRLPAGARVRLETHDGWIEIPLEGKRVLLVANINSYAAGARPFPGNRFDDGVLEVAVYGDLWRYLAITAGSRLLPRLADWMRGGQPRYLARRLELHLPHGTPLQIDGEDATHGFSDGALNVSFAARVRLLDLRRSFYALF